MINRLYHVLVVEDSPDDFRVLMAELADARYSPFKLHQEQELTSAIERVKQRDWDLVLLDVNLLDSTGEQTITQFLDVAQYCAVIVMTGSADHALAELALAEGAQDFLIKGQIFGDNLVRAMLFAIKRQVDQQEIRQLKQELERRVESRTKDLTHTIHQLQAEVLGRERAEASLRESEERHRLYLQNAADPIVIMDYDGIVRWSNHQAHYVLGYKWDELSGMFYEHFCTPKGLNRARVYFQELLQKGDLSIPELWIKRGQGDAIPMDITAKVIEVQGEPRIQAILRDVSSRYEAQQAIGHRLKLEQLVASLSSRFVQCSLDEMDQVIVSALQSLAEFSDAERGCLFLFSKDLTSYSNTHEWCLPGVASLQEKRQGLSIKEVGLPVEALTQGKIVQIPRVLEPGLPYERLKKHLQQADLFSVIYVPMRWRERILGFLSFATCAREKQWSEEDLVMLRLAGEIFAGALLQQEMEQRLRNDLYGAQLFGQQVDAQRQELQTVLDGLPFPTYLVEMPRKTIRLANHKAQQLGIMPDQTCYRVLWNQEQACCDQDHPCALARVLERGTTARVERSWRFADQPKRTLAFHAAPIEDANHNIPWIVETIIDITEMKRLEKQEQFHAFQSGVAEMAVTLLHNIGNAIMSIMNRAENIEQQSIALQKQAAMLQRVGGVANRKMAKGEDPVKLMCSLGEALTDIGDEIVSLAENELKKNATQIHLGVRHISEIIQIHQNASKYVMYSQFDLSELIEDALIIQADILEKYKIEVTVNISPLLRQVNLPRSQFLQMMINLIKNAREAIADRTAPNDEPNQIGISVMPKGVVRMLIHVVDNGCGIAEEDLTRIFHFGVTMKKQGSGLGLHSIANFVQGLEGTIEAISAGKDKGALFNIELPVDCQAQENQE
ncbi:PAS domain S-box protein [Magnetococcus sp. PR-3]|uniref:PAS domain S-box protein n=1 Tax=Magnetococcus sp. PR-3 TaxID=3120355 RepID=UPI002FCE5F89